MNAALLLLALAAPVPDDDAAASAAPVASVVHPTARIERLRLIGLGRTLPDTIFGLLPRRAPTTFTGLEITELERRINNLGIFDDVKVHVAGEELVVTVREKWTLTPSVEFSTGETLEDTEGSVGATEYNFLGRAAELGVQVGREQRGPTAWIWYLEHAYHPRRWAFVAAAGVERASLRFDPDGAGTSWFRDRGAAEIGWRTPYTYGLPLRYEVGAAYVRELITRDEESAAAAPPEGHAFGSQMILTWDRYTWRDLAPAGWRVRLQVRPGWFVPDASRTDADCATGCRPMARFAANAQALASAPLGKLTVLAGRAAADFVSSGNANHSALVGSQDGVRGLRDALYRNRAQAYVNVELRHAVMLAKRWALQGVVFADAAVFEPMDARGRATSVLGAVSTGIGLRVVPTFLTQIVGRIDVARLHTPDERWFLQLGVTQYF